jgi:hypothetical protein
MPTASVRIQLLGRTYPISRQGVRDSHVHTSTRTALSGATTAFPARMTRIEEIPSGPNPRRAAATSSPTGRLRMNKNF